MSHNGIRSQYMPIGQLGKEWYTIKAYRRRQKKLAAAAARKRRK